MSPERADIVQEALDFFKVAAQTNQEQAKREKEDLQFQIPELMWTDEAKAARNSTTVNGIPIPARPMLSIATLDEPIELVWSQFTGAHLGVNVHPLSADASDDTASVLQGIYRHIEVDSNANQARGWAFDRAMKCGRGCYEVTKEYDHTTGVPGDQKIIIRRKLYQGAVYFDYAAIEPDWSDGERAIEVFDLPWTTYKRKYKKSAMARMSDSELVDVGAEVPDWVSGDDPASRGVRIAKYWYIEHDSETVTIPGAGRNGTDLEIEKDVRHVKCATINAVETLDEYDHDGQYIPLIPVIGRELQPFDSKRRWKGIITNAKDGARLTNYAASGAVEMAALEPKAPWQMEEGQDEGYAWEYEQANIRNFPVLHFRSRNLAGEKVQERPSRVQVDASRLGPNMQLLQMGQSFVQQATAIHPPSLGINTASHRSGEAIKELKDQSFAANSSYLYNLAEVSMTYEARVILDWIPHIYDRPGRVMQILDGENKPKQVMLNQPYMPHPQSGMPIAIAPGQPIPQQALHYDLNKGRYGVTVTIGKSYKSQLEQGQSEIGDIMQADPSLVPLIGPVYFKYRDGPGMKEIADLLQKQRDHAMPWLADNPQAAALDPQKLMAENQQLKQQLGAAAQVIKGKQVEKQTEMQGKFQIAAMQEDAETQRAAADREVKLAVAELSAKVERMALFLNERARLGEHIADLSEKMRDRAHDIGTQALEHAQELRTGALDHAATTIQATQANDHALAQAAQAADLAPDPQQAQTPQGD